MLRKPCIPEIKTFNFHGGKKHTYITVDCSEATKLLSIIPDSLCKLLQSIKPNQQQTKTILKFNCTPEEYFKELSL